MVRRKSLSLKAILTIAFVLVFYPGARAFSRPDDPNIFVPLAKKIVPSVVNISTISTVKTPYLQGAPDDLFRRFFEEFFKQHGGGDDGDRGGDDEDQAPSNPPNTQGNRLPKQMSLGTGFIIDSSGLILTNNHVVAGADEIKIFFTESSDEKPTDGKVVGRDPEVDVALIRVNTKRKLTPVVLGDSDSIEVGQYVIAVGNPFGQGHSVTHGIISAKGRIAPDFPLATYLQTDAPINPGNSGGPLVNLNGEVIGINNAIEQHAQGIGFAIPINLVKSILPQLRTKGVVTRGYIGILVGELTPEIAAKIGAPKDLRAPFVTNVYPGPAERAGVKPYDVVLEFNHKPVHSAGELVSAVTSVPVGTSVPLKISRGDRVVDLTIRVAKRPGSSQLTDEEAPQPRKKHKAPSHINAGMTLEDLTADSVRDLGLPKKTKGVVVSDVNYGGPADQAGLMRGDLILEVDRKAVTDVDEFYSIVKEKKSYLLRVMRPDPRGSGGSYVVVILNLKG